MQADPYRSNLPAKKRNKHYFEYSVKAFAHLRFLTKNKISAKKKDVF